VVSVVARTSNRTELTASWSAADPESGIREYQYAIGHTPGSTDVRPFTATAQSAVIASGLSLDAGVTYYFAVRAANNAGLVSDVVFSSGIVVDLTYQPAVKIIAGAPQSASESSGITLLSRAATSVVLKAFDSSGNSVGGAGVRNPVIVSLAAGQQYTRTVL